MAADHTPETDLHRLAEIAYNISEKVREENPVRVRSQLEDLCEKHPMKAAQVIMCLAIWFDPETTTTELFARVDAVASRPLGRAS